MVRVSAWAGLRRFKGVGSWFGILLAYSRSSWSPIKANWRPQARATLSLILREEKAGVFRIHHKYGELNKNLFFIKLFLPKSQARAVCLFLVLIVELGQGRDYTVPQGARVHLTRSSLEGDDTTWASCLFHHFVFWEHICKLFISCSRLLRTSTGQTMAPQPESVCVLSLLRLPTVNNRLCKYWLMWPG